MSLFNLILNIIFVTCAGLVVSVGLQHLFPPGIATTIWFVAAFWPGPNNPWRQLGRQAALFEHRLQQGLNSNDRKD